MRRSRDQLPEVRDHPNPVTAFSVSGGVKSVFGDARKVILAWKMTFRMSKSLRSIREIIKKSYKNTGQALVMYEIPCFTGRHTLNNKEMDGLF